MTVPKLKIQPVQPSGHQWFNRPWLPRIAGIGIALVMTAVVAGWAFRIESLTGTFGFAQGRVMPNTAFSFLGLGLAWLAVAGGRPRGMAIARGFAGLAGLIGVLTLVEYLAGADFGIDELVLSESALFPGYDLPGRMAPELALCITLLAVAFQLTVVRRKRVAHTLISGGCSLVVLAIALESLVLFAAPGWVQGWFFPDFRMSDLSALTLAVLGAVSFAVEWRTRSHSWSIDLLNTLALAVVVVLLSAAGMKLASMSGESLVAGRVNAQLHTAHEEVLSLRYDVAMARAAAVHPRQGISADSIDALVPRIRDARPRLLAIGLNESRIVEKLQEVAARADDVAGLFSETVAPPAEGEPIPEPEAVVAREAMRLGRFDDAADEAMKILRDRIAEVAREESIRAVRSRRVLFGGTAGSLLIILFTVLRLNKAETARRRSDDGLARAQAVAEIGHWRIDMQGNDSDVSAETRRIYGVPESGKMSHEAFLSCIHPDDFDWVEARWQAALAGENYDVEYRIVVDGEIRWVHELGEVVRSPSGIPVSGVGIVRDITREREAAQALHRLATIIRETPDMVVVCDAALSVTFVNRSAASVFDRGVEQKPQTLVLAGCFAEADYARLVQVAIPAATRDGTWTGRAVLRVADRPPVPVSILVIAHKGKDGELEQYSLVMSDISSLAAAEEADRALREEQRSRANLLSALPGMSYRCLNDAAWTFEFVSPGCQALTGYGADELIGDAKVSYGSLIHPEDRDTILERVHEAVGVRRPFELVYRITARDGAQKWVSESGAGVFDEAGRLVAYEGFVADITERRLAEVRIAASEQKFSALFRSSPVAMTITRLSDGKITEVNSTFERMSGRKAADVVGRTVFQIGLVSDSQKRDRLVAELRSSGRVLLTESFIFDASGNRRETLFTAELVTIAGEDCALVSTIDVTGQRRAEEQVRLQASAIDAAANAIALTDREGRVLFANPAFSRMTGIPAGKAVGEGMRLLESGLHDRNFFEKIRATVHSGDVWHGEITNRRGDGTRYIVEQTITPVFDETGAIAHLIVIAQDVTETRRREEEVLRAERLSSVGRLAGGIAHDLNNILAPMMMVPSLVRPSLRDPEALRMLEFIETNARRGAAIIKQLLTFSRGTSGPRRTVVAAELVTEVEAMIRETFPKSIRTRADVRSDDATVVVDPTQIHQVLMNLCVNARDAMPLGGQLTLSTELVEIGPEAVETTPGATPGPHVVIAVTDTGIGIPSDVIGKIYDPFFTTKAFGEGTGLGLSTSLGIVRSHGGILSVTSEPGHGTRFEVCLPVGARSQETRAAAPAEGGERGQGEWLLLVEDEENARQTLRACLERGGYRVVEARNGAEGLEKFSTHAGKIDAVITDFSMPVMDGAEFVRKIREVRRTVPVILCSGNMSAAMQTGSKVDANYFLAKPFMPADLLNALRTVLPVLTGPAQ